MTVHQFVDQVADGLAQWMPTQRWFAGKNRPVRSVEALESTELLAGDPRLVHVIVEVVHSDGGTERYQLLLGVRHELPEHLTHASIGAADRWTVYDAVHDHELTAKLIELVATDAKADRLTFNVMSGTELDTSVRARPVSAEQSNTSLVYGQRYILKLFRRLQPGVSPDLELHRALHEVGCEHIAAPLGWIEDVPAGEEAPTTLGMLSEFLPNTADGWRMATASVRDLMAEGDLHAHEVGGDFAAEAHRLGHAVAAVHADLDAALGHATAGPDELATEVAAMHGRLDAALAAVPELADHEPALRAAFDAARDATMPVLVQRIHGDLHLGQALRTPLHWVIIDFEGEPLRPIADRRSPSSPLRDVAGMLRSFDYAAHQMLVGQDGRSDRQHTFRALEWARRNRKAFLDGYTRTSTGDPVYPHKRADAARSATGTIDLERDARLLRAFELDKAVYEVRYEVSNRPDWLPIPLSSIARLTAS